MRDGMCKPGTVVPLLPTQGQGSGGEGEAVGGINNLVSGSITPPWARTLPAPVAPTPASCSQSGFLLTVIPFLIGSLEL